ALWSVLNLLDCVNELGLELTRGLNAAIAIPLKRRVVFPLDETQWLFLPLRIARPFSRTVCQETDFIFPECSSSARRAISSWQAASALGSRIVSRLSMRVLASSARSSSDKASACCNSVAS